MDAIFKVFDENPMVPAGLALLLIMMIFMKRRTKQEEPQSVEHARTVEVAAGNVHTPAPQSKVDPIV